LESIVGFDLLHNFCKVRRVAPHGCVTVPAILAVRKHHPAFSPKKSATAGGIINQGTPVAAPTVQKVQYGTSGWIAPFPGPYDHDFHLPGEGRARDRKLLDARSDGLNPRLGGYDCHAEQNRCHTSQQDAKRDAT